MDVDPLKQQMPVFYVDAKARFRADAATALRQLNGYIESSHAEPSRSRSTLLDAEFSARSDKLARDEQPRADAQLSCSFLTASLRHALADKDPVYLVEAVTMTSPLHCRRCRRRLRRRRRRCC